MHIIANSALMLFTDKYHNQSMLVETTACQTWHILCLISPCLLKLQLAKVGTFCRHNVPLYCTILTHEIEEKDYSSTQSQMIQLFKLMY